MSAADSASQIAAGGDDVPVAVSWYTEPLGVEPYFSRSVDGTPAYAEFRIGDYQHELGIVDRHFAPHAHSDQSGVR